jgi:DNA primase
MATEKEIDEIKNKISLYDIASSYIKLKKSGSNYFGLCPFHNEKTPSFSVNDELGIFKCFGCQESGDVISFVEKIENITFRDAIEKLADMAGVTLSNEFKNEKSEKKRILEINALSAELFSFLLTKHAVGKNAREYVAERNISKASIKEFRLGYDYKNSLVTLLQKRGFSDAEIIKYGLGVVRDRQLVDKYRGRLIFPILSITGDVVGFSGRIIVKNDKIPKYLNSPETEVFQKNRILYGLYNAKKYIKENDNAILLEGPIDVISAFQHGVMNVCAVQGTSLTINHLTILHRLTENISFCFDQDNAGLKALRRSFFTAIDADVNPKVIKINDAKDLDERVNTDKKGFMEDMSKSLDVVEFLINKDVEELNTSTLDGKIKVINDILPLIIRIKDDIKKSYYLAKLAEAVQVNEAEIRKMMVARSEEYKKEIVKNIEKNIRNENSRLEYLLALFLQHFKELKSVITKFDESAITDLNVKSLIIKLKQAIEEDKDIKAFIGDLDGKEKEYCITLMTIDLKKLKNDDISYVKEEIETIAKILRKKKTIGDINEMKNRLWVYEKEHDEEKSQETIEQIATLSKEIELV